MVTSLSFFITLLVKYIASENFATRDTKKPAIMVKKTPSNVNFGKEYFEFFVGGITGQFFFGKPFCSLSVWLFQCFCFL